MQIIDFRFRPHTKETLETLSNSPIFRKGLLESGRDLDAFVASAKTMDAIADELKAANFMRAVIVGRDAETTYQFKPNHEEIIPFYKNTRTCLSVSPEWTRIKAWMQFINSRI